MDNSTFVGVYEGYKPIFHEIILCLILVLVSILTGRKIPKIHNDLSKLFTRKRFHDHGTQTPRET